jgi:hypothetical protein
MITNGSPQQSEAGTASDSKSDADRETPRSEQPGYAPPHPLDGLMKHVRELIEYASFYVETRKDSVRASIRGLILKAALGVLAGIIGATVLIVATVYLMSGIAAGLGWLFGERWELGRFALAAIVLVALGIGAFVMMKMMDRKARQRTVKKYEQRQQNQQSRFGNSVRQRAAEIRNAHRE